MAIQIGTATFDGRLGPGPELPRPQVILYTRPGTANVGARVQSTVGLETEVRVVRHLAESSRLTTQAGYRSLIGTVVAYIEGAVNYATSFGVNFLVIDVTIEESATIPRAVGIDPTGSQIDIAPAGRIVSRWRMIAVPSS